MFTKELLSCEKCDVYWGSGTIVCFYCVLIHDFQKSSYDVIWRCDRNIKKLSHNARVYKVLLSVRLNATRSRHSDVMMPKYRAHITLSSYSKTSIP